MKWISSILNFFSPSPERIGSQGESLTAAMLKLANFFGNKGLCLQNVYVPKGNGELTEIDLLYITRKGILVIESKNYSGYIFGNERNAKWTMTLYAGKDWLGFKHVEKHQFYNPIWQNKTHMNALRDFLGRDVPLFSVIVFSDRCELKNISISSAEVYICNRGVLPRIVRGIWDSNPDVLTEDEISKIYAALLPLENRSQEMKQRHAAQVQAKINNNSVCPWCGGKLVCRTAKRGSNPNHRFLGCEKYPKCRFTKNL